MSRYLGEQIPEATGLGNSRIPLVPGGLPGSKSASALALLPLSYSAPGRQADLAGPLEFATGCGTFMLFGPIFSADVVSSGRRARYFWIRVAYALLVLMVMALCYAPNWNLGMPTIRSTAALAAAFFSSFATLQITAVLLLGPAFTAGSISTERERRTIEYLFATDLSNVEIVYGKFAAALMRMIVLLLVSLPILAIARLLGGIAGNRMLCVFAVTASTAVAVTALSITISVWTPRARDAVIRTYLVLFGLLALPLLASIICGVLLNLPGMHFGVLYYPLSAINQSAGVISAGNPYVALIGILAQDLPGVNVNAQPWQMVGILALAQGIVTALCAVLAPWGVRRVHLNAAGRAAPRQPEAALAVPVALRPDGEQLPDAELAKSPVPQVRVRGSRRAVSEDSPMLWKELLAEHAQSSMGLAGRIVLSLAVLMIVGTSLISFGFYLSVGSSLDAGAAFQSFVAVMATLVICGTLLLLAARGATSITIEKERDTWTALLGTPLEPAEIILAKFWATLYSGRWALPLLGFLWLLGAIAYPYSLIGLPLVLVTIAILASFFSALGIAFSLRCSNSTRSLGATLAVCVLLGGGYYLCCGCLMVPLSMLGVSGGDTDILAMLTIGPWPPFLTFVPHFAGTFIDEELGRSEVGPMIMGTVRPIPMAYVAGNIGYLIGAAVVLASSIVDFNRVTGRPSERSQPPSNSVAAGLPATAAQQPLPAEMLEEDKTAPPSTGEL